MMGIDILEKQEIITYRKNDLDLLFSIRNGEFQKKDGLFCDEFYEIVQEYQKKFNYAAAHTLLPDEPNMNVVQEYVMSVNKKVVNDEI